MKWSEDIKSELRRSFDFKGRTARRSYFLFLSVAILAFSAALAVVPFIAPSVSVWAKIAIVTALFYIPVTSAGVRRLHDADLSGTLMLDPVKPILAISVTFFVLPLLYWLFPLSTGFSIWWLALSGIGTIIFFAAVLGGVIMTLVFFSNTMSSLMLPSHPSANKYGPNPHEVPT